MRKTYYSKPALDLLGKWFFPNAQKAVRRKDVRSLLLSVLLGIVVCLALGSMLLVLNRQGHI
jgi:hypothetical protein